MDDKELLTSCHKGECICDGCERRFVCWTTKRVFSDPIHQALYEAHIAEGLSHEDALKETRAFLEDAVTVEVKEFKEPIKWEKWDDYNEWKSPNFPSMWQSNKTCDLPVKEAKKEIEDLTKYYRSMISGKSTKG